MTEKTTDILIVGAGPAGIAAALAARRRGLGATVVGCEPPGGTCLHRGCIPVKALLASAAAMRAANGAGAFGVRCAAGALPDWPSMLARAAAAAARLGKTAAARLETAGAEFIPGEARLISSSRAMVSPPDSPPFAVSARNILLAPGAKPMRPAFLRDCQRVLDSDSMLCLPALPKRILVLGGGAIGCEFASLLADLGVSVQIVEHAPRLLPSLDRDCGVALAGAFARRGVRIATGTDVAEVSEDSNGIRVKAADGRIFEADALLAATGRRPATEGLGLGGVGLAPGPRGEIPVDGEFRTPVPGIFACGDAIGSVQTATYAEVTAEAAVAAICGEKADLDLESLPSCVFSHPEIASAGLSEEDAVGRGIAVCVGKASLRFNGMAVATGETDGFAKIVEDSTTGRIVGASFCGAGAAEAIAAAAIAIRHRLPATSLRSLAHPSFAEAFTQAAETLSPRR